MAPLNFLFSFRIHLAFFSNKQTELRNGKKNLIYYFSLKISLKSDCNYISVTFDICVCVCVVHDVIT